MRVLQVTSYYAPAWAYGGPPRVMTEFATGLAVRGHDVTVFTTDVLDGENRACPVREIRDGVRVRRFPNLSNGLAWRSKKYLAPGLVAATAREISGFDVVHATDARTVATATAYVAARVAGVPFVLSAHGSLPSSVGVRGVVKDVYDRLLVRPMLERAALLLAQTSHEEELYREAGGRAEAIDLLPLPLDLSSVPSRFEPGFLRQRAGIPEGVPIVLFLGRIHYLKGLDLLLAAMEPMLDAREVVLAIVGRDDGQWSELAERHARQLDEGTVRFLGPLYGSERFDAYADADIFALTPRHWEETSVAALEAAASGTGVVVTEQSDIPGLVESGGGLVVRAEVSAIRAAVQEGLVRAGAMGPKARALIARHHASDVVVGQLDHLLQRAVARTSGTSSSPLR
jgi:glycosyltransferase involved in cell wall biosynthesis